MVMRHNALSHRTSQHHTLHYTPKNTYSNKTVSCKATGNCVYYELRMKQAMEALAQECYDGLESSSRALTLAKCQRGVSMCTWGGNAFAALP